MGRYNHEVLQLARQYGMTTPPEEPQCQTPWERDLLSAVQNGAAQRRAVASSVSTFATCTNTINEFVQAGRHLPDELIQEVGVHYHALLSGIFGHEASLREMHAVGHTYQYQRQHTKDGAR